MAIVEHMVYCLNIWPVFSSGSPLDYRNTAERLLWQHFRRHNTNGCSDCHAPYIDPLPIQAPSLIEIGFSVNFILSFHIEKIMCCSRAPEFAPYVRRIHNRRWLFCRFLRRRHLWGVSTKWIIWSEKNIFMPVVDQKTFFKKNIFPLFSIFFRCSLQISCFFCLLILWMFGGIILFIIFLFSCKLCRDL